MDKKNTCQNLYNILYTTKYKKKNTWIIKFKYIKCTKNLACLARGFLESMIFPSGNNKVLLGEKDKK